MKLRGSMIATAVLVLAHVVHVFILPVLLGTMAHHSSGINDLFGWALWIATALTVVLSIRHLSHRFVFFRV